MLSSTGRLAVRCAFFLLLGLFLSLTPSCVSAQQISEKTIASFGRTPVPVVSTYVPWASNANYTGPSHIKAFPATPLPNNLVIAVAIATTVLLSVSIRPRKLR